jgi:hypothetical protein
MARKSRNRVRNSTKGGGKAKPQVATGSSDPPIPGQTRGQFEQDLKRRIGDYGRTGDAHRKT